jgi:lysozyme family protein/peptidoglycan hydrolase-like protein with peptidoglycan-binding domain
MKTSFEAIKQEYTDYAASAKPINEKWAAKAYSAAQRLLATRSHYTAVSAKTGVPIAWIMAINERESGNRFDTYLGNGQSLKRVTTMVPRGRGPWATWDAGAIDGLHYDRVDVPHDWTVEYALYRSETWNGLGPRWHGKPTGYNWSGTTIYKGGKYTETPAGSTWNPDMWDEQLGTFLIMQKLIELDPSLAFTNAIVPAEVPFNDPQAVQSVSDHVGVVADTAGFFTGVAWIQDSLNRVNGAGLAIDSSYGRHTRAAVRAFQAANGLDPDGKAGPLTCAGIDRALAKLQNSTGSKSPPSTQQPVIITSALQPTTQKVRHMDFANIIGLAQLVAPQFVPALAGINPLLPVAINVLGEALGASAPHTSDSVATVAASKAPDELGNAIKAAALEYAKHVTAGATSLGVTTGDQSKPIAMLAPPAAMAPVSAPVAPATSPSTTSSKILRTGGALLSTWLSGGLHAMTAIGGVIAGSGLLDPGGPIASLATGRPWVGLGIAVLSALINHAVVSASNDATNALPKV